MKLNLNDTIDNRMNEALVHRWFVTVTDSGQLLHMGITNQ